MHHFTVNHSKHFVDPISSANTQTIELSWRAVKRSLKTEVKQDNIADNLAECLYCGDVVISGGDPFSYFLKAIHHVYIQQNRV